MKLSDLTAVLPLLSSLGLPASAVAVIVAGLEAEALALALWHQIEGFVEEHQRVPTEDEMNALDQENSELRSEWKRKRGLLLARAGGA